MFKQDRQYYGDHIGSNLPNAKRKLLRELTSKSIIQSDQALNVNLDVETMLITEEDVKSKNGMRIWHKKTVKSFQEDQTKTYWENEANKPTV